MMGEWATGEHESEEEGIKPWCMTEARGAEALLRARDKRRHRQSKEAQRKDSESYEQEGAQIAARQ
jgi:hypothetical protein